MTQPCTKCGKDELRVYMMCDREEGAWCEDCFKKMPCGNGKHGEGCPTKVFEDGEGESP